MLPRNQTLFHLSWPIYIELLLGMMTGFADTYFLSQISTKAAAGVGATLTLFALVSLTTGNLSRAAGNIAAQHIGAGNHKRASECYGLTIWLVLGGGIISSLLVFWCRKFLPLDWFDRKRTPTWDYLSPDYLLGI